MHASMHCGTSRPDCPDFFPPAAAVEGLGPMRPSPHALPHRTHNILEVFPIPGPVACGCDALNLQLSHRALVAVPRPDDMGSPVVDHGTLTFAGDVILPLVEF